MIVDTNVHFDRWPTRRLPDDEPKRLLARLAEHDVAGAWVGSFDAVLHRDVAAVNQRLMKLCRIADRERLVPVGTINPTLPDWQEDLRRCAELHGMRALRVYPGYHGYALDDESAAELLTEAARLGILLQIVANLEDERTQHPLLRATGVDVEPLIAWMGRLPELHVMVLGARRPRTRPEVIEQLVSTGRVTFDLSMLEGAGCVAGWIEQFGHESLVFGSHAPLFAFESALLKIAESPLGELQRRAILAENAQRQLDQLAELP